VCEGERRSTRGTTLAAQRWRRSGGDDALELLALWQSSGDLSHLIKVGPLRVLNIEHALKQRLPSGHRVGGGRPI
jgi:hypothetical protein